MEIYNICNNPDESLFYRQCEALENNIPNLIKENLLNDVDGSLVQIYKLNGKNIIVRNNVYIGALYIETDIDLEKYF